MTTERLTKNELTWLLAQEARSASAKLRQGVSMYTAEPTAPQPPTGGVEVTLNLLDEAVDMLANLHGHPSVRGRRGKIDMAALFWEVAPDARVQIEMGEGTTVFGDEAELRRMLHVLIGHSGGAKGGPAVTIRREGDEIRIGANLGPDTSATFATERAWLSRMAIRYGGRLELDGSMQTLILAADVDPQRRELESLKKELAAAQAQGEAYARELAALFTREVAAPEPDVGAPGASGATPSQLPPTGDGLAVLVAAVRVLGADLRGILSSIGRDIAPLRDRQGDVGEIAASVGRHVTGASEVVGDLARLGACPIGELPRQADVADLLRDAVTTDAARADRHGVRITLRAPDDAQALVPVGTLSVLFHVLLDHAIDASPPGSEIAVTLAEESAGGEPRLVVTFEDAGSPLPPSAHAGVLSRDFEVLAGGRPRALSLIAAHAIAAHLTLPIELGAGPSGGARIRLALPSSVA